MTERYIFDIETTGLYSEVNRITCIVLINLETGKEILLCDENEKIVLDKFWEVINGDILIGFNITSFDIPFVVRRSEILGVSVNSFLYTDIRHILTNGDRYMKGRLHDWAKLHLGIEPKTENGFKMIEYWNTKQYDKILEHCLEDVKLTKLLYEKINKEK